MDQMQDLIQEMIKKQKALYDDCDWKPTTEVREMREIMLAMSDGTKLRTQLFIPRGNEEADYPLILQRSCYPFMEGMLKVNAMEYCRRGFAFVIQWCRGTGGSEGIWEPNVNERQDGLDTLNWLNGLDFVRSIGYLGDSYLALTGWCMADAVPDKVKTMYLGVYGTDRHTSAYKDGMFRQDILTAWAMDNAGKPVAADYLESARFRPQMEVDETLWGTRLDWYRDWIGNTDRDGEYWSHQGFWKMLKEIPGKVKIPIFILEGWYDHHLGSAIVTYGDLSEEAKKHSVFQIGPWNHGRMPAVCHQPLNHLEEDRVSSPLEWFRKLLMDEQMPEGEVRTYVIGADKWESWNQFPVPAIEKAVFSFSFAKPKGFKEAAHGSLGGATGHLLHRKALESPEGQDQQEVVPGKIMFAYDPEKPVPSHGAESCFRTQEAIGSLPQPRCGYRDDVVSFVSDVVTKRMEVGGSIAVRLYVASDAEDTAFTAKVMEVFPDGVTVNIRSGITTLAYRCGRSRRGSYEPGEVVEIVIRMWDVAWEVQEGSRLRVDISSSDFPQYSVHSNYPGVWSVQEKTKVALQEIHIGEGHPCVLELPLVHQE